MKSIFAIFALILLVWDICLQIQVNNLSNPTTTKLKLSRLDIVDPTGKSVITAIASDTGGGILTVYNDGQRENFSGTVIMGNTVGCIQPDKKEGTYLGSNGISIDYGDPPSSIRAASLLQRDGTGKLLLYTKPDEGISLQVDPRQIKSFDSNSKMLLWSENPDAFIDVNSKAFSTAKSNEGAFLISCQGVEPYLEGYKVHLRIGNPTTLMVSNPTLSIQWGPVVPALGSQAEQEKAYDNWKASLRKMDTTLMQDLKPGSWNEADVILSPAKADELAYFKVSIQTDSVSLSVPSNEHR